MVSNGYTSTEIFINLFRIPINKTINGSFFMTRLTRIDEKRVHTSYTYDNKTKEVVYDISESRIKISSIQENVFIITI